MLLPIIADSFDLSCFGHFFELCKSLAPVILEENWKTEYEDLLYKMQAYLQNIDISDFRLEIISHRFTTRAKNNILQVFPQTLLPMDEKTDRKFKYGQFGYGKFVYTDEKLNDMKVFFTEKINKLLPGAVIDYII
jgi:spore photoproduct lyase